MRAALAALVMSLVAAAASLTAQSPARAGYDLAYIGPPLADPVLQQAKETYIVMGCAYCHGINLTPRGEAADLMHSPLVGADVNGNVLVPLLRAGVPNTRKLSPMPQYSDLSERQLADLVRWIHYARQRGRQRELSEAPLPAGDAAAGQTYFDRQCVSCHAPAGEFSRVATRYGDAGLRAAILVPAALRPTGSHRLDQGSDARTAMARQRHDALLENYAASDVANLAAYMRSLTRAPAAPGLTVTTRAGRLAGGTGYAPSMRVFRGVPYAAPPVGPLRWAAPVPAASWTGVRPAIDFGANCPQTIVEERRPWTYEFMAHGAVSEDCLFLNVWTSAATGEARRPVFVYLHGGGFNEGSGAVPVYDGEGLARKGLVVVTVNYRLGSLGFLAHPELTAASGGKASGNYALLDQIAALQWIRDNIAAFGGDPGRVTLAGQSAGGISVLALMASPLAKGLFHRAIVESAIGGAPDRSLAEAEADGVRFVAAKGAASLAELRATPAGEVARREGFAFRPITDGYVLPTGLDAALAAGCQLDVPVIIGANADEAGATPQGDEPKNEAARDRLRGGLYSWALARAPTSTCVMSTPAFRISA
jgi:mono/diheme cytochrome c family protein